MSNTGISKEVINSRQNLFNIDIEYGVSIIKSILAIYEEANNQNRELDFDENKKIEELPSYPDNRQSVLICFDFLKLKDECNIDKLIFDAITIMDNLCGKENKDTFRDYSIGNLHGYRVWYKDEEEPDYTLYYSLTESTSAY